MLPLLASQGHAALQAVMRLQPLLAFDFDGTLAPIVARPAQARVPAGLARRMAALARRWPVAIISGRDVIDVRPRLGFTPQYLVGSHGAEGLPHAIAAADLAALRSTALLLQRHAAALATAGVELEQKALSLALHYRRAADSAQALRCIDAILRGADPALRRFGGKYVVNLVPRSAPDKADALEALVSRSGSAAAVFVGDDENDEPVFERAPAHWLTVRVGNDGRPSAARFCLARPAALTAMIDLLLVEQANAGPLPSGAA